MTQRDALLRAICGAPSDDLPRLVYADWLDENGETERAAFIRTMCRLEELFRDIDRGVGMRAVNEMNPLDQAAWKLWEKHGVNWLAELPAFDGITWPNGRWRRGLPGGVTADTVGQFVKSAARIAVTIPLTGVVIRRVQGVTALLKCPCLRTVHVLTMAGAGLNDRMADELCASDALDHLQLLDLKGNRVTRAGVRRLTKRYGDRVSAILQRT